MIYLDLEDLIHIARRVLGTDPAIRDVGLLEAAAARPQATLAGHDAYPDVRHKAAALLQSIVRNHALIDGNKRLGLAATIAFLGINGTRLMCSNDEAYDLVIAVSVGTLADVPEIAVTLVRLTDPARHPPDTGQPTVP